LVVGDGTCGGGVVLLDGSSVAGSFGESDGTGDDDPEGVEEMFTDLRFDVSGQIGACIVHGEQYAAQFELWVEIALDEFDGVGEVAESFEGEIFALDGDDDFISGGEGVDSEKAERGWAINEDEVEVVSDGFECALHTEFAGHDGDKFDFGSDEGWAGGDYGDAGGGGGLDSGEKRGFVYERFVERTGFECVGAEGGCGVALRVGIDDEDALSTGGEGSSERYGCRRFTDAAFLVGECECEAQSGAPRSTSSLTIAAAARRRSISARRGSGLGPKVATEVAANAAVKRLTVA
jgi:hypothetical protein